MKAKMCNGKKHVVVDAGKFQQRGMFIWMATIRPTGVKRIRIKCPECGRKLWSSVSLCHDGCCLIHELPVHKIKGWWKRKNK
jgi:hypothetical protein